MADEEVTLTLEMPEEEELFRLMKYKLDDPAADSELEIDDYLASRDPETLPAAERFTGEHSDRPTKFYANSRQFFVGLMTTHLNLQHLRFRSRYLMALARASNARTYADWGAGSGRDCIVMARLGLAVDFYNFDLAKAGPHLPKNFVYGGLMQMALERIGMRKVMGEDSVWYETAAALRMIWHKPWGLVGDETAVTASLRVHVCELLKTFRSFYDEELLRNLNALAGALRT